MRSIFIIPFILCLVACSDNYHDDTLLTGQWELYAVVENSTGEMRYYPDSLENYIFMEITDSGQVCLTGYCNSGHAYYSFNNNELFFHDVTLTEMGCIANAWEEYFYDLNQTEDFDLEEAQLIIYTNSEVDLYFRRRDPITPELHL